MSSSPTADYAQPLLPCSLRLCRLVPDRWRVSIAEPRATAGLRACGETAVSATIAVGALLFGLTRYGWKRGLEQHAAAMQSSCWSSPCGHLRTTAARIRAEAEELLGARRVPSDRSHRTGAPSCASTSRQCAWNQKCPSPGMVWSWAWGSRPARRAAASSGTLRSSLPCHKRHGRGHIAGVEAPRRREDACVAQPSPCESSIPRMARSRRSHTLSLWARPRTSS